MRRLDLHEKVRSPSADVQQFDVVINRGPSRAEESGPKKWLPECCVLGQAIFDDILTATTNDVLELNRFRHLAEPFPGAR